MPSLLEIKTKITATKGTQKITKAMQLVAASKMKSFQKTAASVVAYTKNVVGTMAMAGATLERSRFSVGNPDGKTLFVVVTSDKGLCGAMNVKLLRKAFEGGLWKNTPEDKRLVMTIGKKSAEAARARNIETIASFAGISEDFQAMEALEVTAPILQLWKEGELKEVILISPEYVNPFVFNTHARAFLPITQETLAQYGAGEKPKQEASFFEPSNEQVISVFNQRLVECLFMEAFYHLKATEYSSRMVAMKKATEAAEEKIKELTNIFNKLRQGAITQELSELAAANEAMSSQNEYEQFNV